jgi:hypothetical protein
MEINITNTEKKALLYHDIFGAIYLVYNNILYLVHIDDDKIILSKINQKIMIEINNELIDYYKGTILPLLTKNSLKEKLNNLNDTNDTYDTTNLRDNLNYFPEDKYFIKKIIDQKIEKTIFLNTIDDNGDDCDDCNNDEYHECDDDIVGGYIFYGYNNKLVLTKTIEQSSCNHDTLIVDGDIDSKNYIFLAECKEHNSYRITLFTSGKMILNIIGSHIRSFKLIDDDGIISIM